MTTESNERTILDTARKMKVDAERLMEFMFNEDWIHKHAMTGQIVASLEKHKDKLLKNRMTAFINNSEKVEYRSDVYVTVRGAVLLAKAFRAMK